MVGSFDRFDFEMYVKTNYTLIVTVRKHPTIILREEYQDPKSFRYVVDLNQAESPVWPQMTPFDLDLSWPNIALKIGIPLFM